MEVISESATFAL